ncbi:transposase [Romeria aff. gracilis LEGE 07310]|uniref:Transposase n=1 Tax=Vasconcelosia minhoensis LEGE 07310 TaxID=915328 RepID=A0A8J7A8S8_9CYAN|nr:transposase [Romeria aff. gracilis LEGE 07310]
MEVIDSHSQEEMIAVLKQQPIELREQVAEVSVNMWGGFGKVVKVVFPKAKLVYDRFHVMRAVNEELNQIRRQTKMTLKGSKRVLVKNGVDLNPEEQTKLARVLNHSKRLRTAYELKEEFREIFEACRTVKQGQASLLR